tara:strand:+ start:5677 stop:6354 length:678 start_codon:yes stop_codon:yes gene_type:complete
MSIDRENLTEHYKSFRDVDENFLNINMPLDENDYPTAERSQFPVTFKHNWDYKPVVSLPFLSEDECSLIINKWVEPEDVDHEENKSYRKCKINWINYYKPGWEWFFDKILNVVEDVNKKYYKFELSNPITLEPVQFTKYSSGGFYSKHTDWEGGGILDIRKLSWVVNLSDPSEYRGGNLQVLKDTVPKNIGWIHLFPSFLRHQATKVFKGKRYSLVGWTVGPPFK